MSANSDESILELGGKETVKGVGLELEKSRNQEEREEDWEDDELPSQEREIENPQLLIQDIPASCTRDALLEACEACAPVRDIRLLPSRSNTGSSSSSSSASQHAYVTFESPLAARRAQEELQKISFGEKRLRVTFTKSKEKYEMNRRRRLEENETLRACDYESVLDDPHLQHLRRCDTCGRDERRHDIRACTGCGEVAYCGKECQQKRWKTHRNVCRGVVEKRKALLQAQETKEIAEERGNEGETTAAATVDEEPANVPAAAEALDIFTETIDDSATSPGKKSPTLPSPSRSAKISSPQSTSPDPPPSSRSSSLSRSIPPLRQALPCSIIHVEDPSEFSVLLRDVDSHEKAARYFLLSQILQAFVRESSRPRRSESVVVGDVVLAPMREEEAEAEEKSDVVGVVDEDENAPALFCRAIVTGVSKKLLRDEKRVVVDLWFCDEGPVATSVPLTNLVSYEGFSNFLARNGLQDFEASLPPRLVRCRLCAVHWDTGKPAPIHPLDANDDGEEGGDAPSRWHTDATFFLRRFIGPSLGTPMEFEAVGMDDDDGVAGVRKCWAMLRGGDANVGEALIDYEYADF